LRAKQVGDVDPENLAKMASILLAPGPQHFTAIQEAARRQFRMARGTAWRCLRALELRKLVERRPGGKGRKTFYKPDSQRIQELLVEYWQKLEAMRSVRPRIMPPSHKRFPGWFEYASTKNPRAYKYWRNVWLRQTPSETTRLAGFARSSRDASARSSVREADLRDSKIRDTSKEAPNSLARIPAVSLFALAQEQIPKPQPPGAKRVGKDA